MLVMLSIRTTSFYDVNIEIGEDETISKIAGG